MSFSFHSLFSYFIHYQNWELPKSTLSNPGFWKGFTQNRTITMKCLKSSTVIINANLCTLLNGHHNYIPAWLTFSDNHSKNNLPFYMRAQSHMPTWFFFLRNNTCKYSIMNLSSDMEKKRSPENKLCRQPLTQRVMSCVYWYLTWNHKRMSCLSNFVTVFPNVQIWTTASKSWFQTWNFKEMWLHAKRTALFPFW